MATEKELVALKTRLSPQERRALQEFVAYLHKATLGAVERVALFGSKARGDSERDSDIDVLVILKEEDRQVRREILRRAARLSLEYDVLLSPRVIGRKRWEELQGFSLYQNVQREAVDLSAETIGI
ncbi:MAG: nucleotidyltransferase domain-containing protein [Anaerolineae bacterium]|nr:MAG: nucleotidyltransferase domain-containing protein [Anaerolineae bacterium]